MWRRRWHYHAFFEGDRYIDVDVDVSEEAVRKQLDERYIGGNWERSSLERGKKVKVPKSQRKA